MVKIKEVEARKFKDIFICRKCNAKIRAPVLKVLSGKVHCRKCKSKALRPKRRK